MNEVFDIFDKNNRPIGKEFRNVVHRDGLYHRSVNILVFNPKGELLIQKRAESKDVCPGKWDLSAAEHLKPGESYQQAAVRGLKEELGIDAKLKKIRDCHLQKNEYPEKGIKDFEFVECWKATSHEKISIDKTEVSKARFMPLQKVKEYVKKRPEDFTPWFRDEIIHCI